MNHFSNAVVGSDARTLGAGHGTHPYRVQGHDSTSRMPIADSRSPIKGGSSVHGDWIHRGPLEIHVGTDLPPDRGGSLVSQRPIRLQYSTGHGNHLP